MAIEKKITLTQEGLTNLEKELEYLKTEKRKEISEKIKVAISFGDLSENSEYDEAKNDQAMVEARINDIEATLSRVTVIDDSAISTEVVNVGISVKLRNEKTGKEDWFKIVGSTEANPREKKISDESPVGKSVLGHKVGDEVDVEAPAGVLKFTVLEITK